MVKFAPGGLAKNNGSVEFFGVGFGREIPDPRGVLKKKRKKSTYPEFELQKSVVGFLGIALPPHSEFFHVPNGEKRSKKSGARLKAMGTKAGIPDLVILWAGIIVFIELKPTKGALSPAQKDRIAGLENAGATVFTCRSVEEVEEVLCTLMPLRATLKGMKS